MCRHSNDFVLSICTTVLEDHACEATTLKHFNPDSMWTLVQFTGSLLLPHTVQAIVVHCELIVNPHLAAIVRYKVEVVCTRTASVQGACPTNCKVIASPEARPRPLSSAIVHKPNVFRRIRSAKGELRESATLMEVEDFLFEPIDWRSDRLHDFGWHNNHSVGSVSPLVPEEHTSCTSAFKHFQPE
jgi:hypothetical protein